jgi:hypothetical protein
MFRFASYPAATIAGSSLLALSLFGRKDQLHADSVVTAAPGGRKYTVGVLGATGTVGQQFLKKLEGVRARRLACVCCV